MHLELEQIGGSKPWVARITGRDPKYGLAREFIQGIRDYSRANKPRTRGVYSAFDFGPGIYEINSPESWGRTARYFLIVRADGTDERTTDPMAALAAAEVRA